VLSAIPMPYAYAFEFVVIFTLLAVFYVYQVFDDDPPEERVGDILEFVGGMVLATVF